MRKLSNSFLSALLLSICLITLPTSSTVAEDSQNANSVISGKFNLLNHLNQDVTEASYDGYYRLVFFGFTECPDICPTTMYHVGQVLDKLGDKAQSIKPLFISVDHETDTTERLASYVKAFHPSIIGLTGDAAQIKQAAQGFNATFGKSNTDNTGYFHSSYLYLMGKDGSLLDLFGYATSQDIILQRLEEVL